LIHYNYTRRQLEEKAVDLLKRFDPERLYKAKPIDVYAVIENCLNAPYDWKYITPDQSILGLTAFKDGYLYVWPKPYYEPGMKPLTIALDKGTILIDSTLTEEPYRGRENFTVMHEVFHQVLHKRCFAHSNPDYTHTSTASALNGQFRRRTSLEICEHQANYCAAAFLMPEDLTERILTQFNGSQGHLYLEDPQSKAIIAQMAMEFSVSNSAMMYRLKNLGLAS